MSASLNFFLTNFIYFLVLFYIYFQVHSFTHAIALSQINRHGRISIISRLVAQWVRLISKEDRVSSAHAITLRFFPLLQLWILVIFMMNLGRDVDGKLVGNLMTVLALILSSSLVNFYHHWALSNKSSMLSVIKNLEIDLFADFAQIITILLAVLRYKSISLMQIEEQQAVVNPLFLAYSGLIVFTAVMLALIKYRQLPFSRKNDQILSGSLLETHYSGFSQVLMQLIPTGHFCLTILLFIFLGCAGGQMHGYQLISIAQPLTIMASPAICIAKFFIIILFSAFFGHTIPLVSISRTKIWLYSVVPVLLALQLVVILLANYQGY